MEAGAAGEGKLGFVLRVPVGVVGAISPFNFPLNLVAHKLGPAIAAGNAVVLKPAGQTPISAIKLAEILLEAGLPERWLSVITGPGLRGRQRARRERAHRRAHLHRLGARRLGIRAKAAAQEGQPRARLDRAADRQRRRRLGAGRRQGPVHAYSHAGQSCISVQRILLHESIAEDFTDALRRERRRR